jgi:sulfhydrogenase subunit alpha
MTRTISVDHLTRVEGHGGITVVLDGNEISKVDFDIFEGIRLFEGLVRGRSIEDVTQIVSRICAICSTNHTVTSMHALENALGVTVTPQTRRLRDLAFHGANIESHSLHVFVLDLPDLMGHSSVISLAGVIPEAVKVALRLKKLGNAIQEVVGGRAVHPINYVIGGFGRVPSTDELVALRDQVRAGLEDCEKALAVLRTVTIPDFVNEPIRCAAIIPENEAFFFGTEMEILDGGGWTRIPVKDYRKFTNEHLVPHSHAKHSLYNGQSYMVGALPRLTLHGDRISGMARKAWNELNLKTPSSNILMNNIAQAVEMIFSVETALHLLDELLDTGVVQESPAPYEAHACTGAAATEVPRGTLFYSYQIDEQGRIAAADIITPTAQNLSNAEDQLRATVKQGLSAGASDSTIEQRLAIVARAYDPCISCSVHVVRAS